MGRKRAPSPFGPAWVGWESYGSVTSSLRYVRSKSSNDFLDKVQASCPNRKLTVPQNKIYFRARLGCEYEEIKTEDDIAVVYDEPRPCE
jgi:hypothetical protein